VASSIEKDLRTLVRSLSGVTAYIGTGANARLYWNTAPDGALTYPYIVYFTVAAAGMLRFLGTRTSDTLVQFSTWHTHPQDGLDCANALFDGLSAYYGTPGDKYIHYITANGPRVLRDPDYDNLYQYVVDVEVRYER